MLKGCHKKNRRDYLLPLESKKQKQVSEPSFSKKNIDWFREKYKAPISVRLLE